MLMMCALSWYVKPFLHVDCCAKQFEYTVYKIIMKE